jgi:hypothetical protein
MQKDCANAVKEAKSKNKNIIDTAGRLVLMKS